MILTHRLLLREMLLTDLCDIHSLLSLPETDRYNVLGTPETIEFTKQLVSEWMSDQNIEPRTSYIYCFTHAETKQFIGLIALLLGKPKYLIGEVWFKTHVDHWGKGYTTEAVEAILRFAFMDLNLHRIEAGCAMENIASSKVLEKAGMVREGMKRKLLPKQAEWKDTYMYAILDEDFYKMNSGKI